MLIFTLIIFRTIIFLLTSGITDTNIANNIEDVVTDSSGIPGLLADFESGDIAAKLGMQDLSEHNIYKNTVDGWLNIIKNAFADTQDYYVDISLHGETPYRLYAHDITVPNNSIKAFCTMFLIAGIIVVIYLDIHRTFLKLQSLDFTKAFDQAVDVIDIIKM